MAARLATIMIAASLGLIVSLYLLSVHWGWTQLVCLEIGDCEVVNASRYAELLGIPVALFGAFTYLTLLATGILIWRHIFEDAAQVVQFLLAAIGVAFSGYLTYIEIFVLRAICPWCVLSAILITLIAGVSVQQLRDPALDNT
jgi:uncharacterized membrane protein